jgi:hypothetical protein
LAILGKGNKQRHSLVRYWVVLTGLKSPKAECQNTEICGGGQPEMKRASSWVGGESEIMTLKETTIDYR